MPRSCLRSSRTLFFILRGILLTVFSAINLDERRRNLRVSIKINVIPEKVPPVGSHESLANLRLGLFVVFIEYE